MGTSIIQQLGRQQIEQAKGLPPAGRLNVNLALTEQRNLAELNEADELARMLAMPREMVLGDITSARAKAQAMRADRLATQAPVTAQWAGKTPERTAISQPSWDNLNKIERIFGKREALEPRSGIEMPGRELLQPTRPISRGIVSATISKSLLNSDLNRMYYNTTWDGRKTPEFKRKEKEILDQIGAIQAPEAEGALETMFESAAQFTGSRITGSAAGASVAGVAAVGALAIGAPVAAVAGTAFGLGTLVRGIAEQSGADIRANNSVPKADPVVADLSGRFSGLVSGSIDYLATKYVAGIFGSAYKKVVGNATAKVLQSPSTRQALINGVKAWGSSIAVETLTETTQQAISLASEQVVRSSADAPAIELERVGRELFETALTTAAGMLILGVPGGAVTTIADLGKVESAKERQTFMSALGDEVKATSLSTTSPSEFKSFVDEVVQMYGPVQNILIPIERFKAYWQEQNVDPRVVAGEIVPDIAAYDEAVSTGGDLVIPLANYVASVAPTEHHAKLMEDVRFRPDDITFREAKEMEAKVAKDIDGLRNDIDEAIKETPTEESAKRVVDDIAARLTATGKYTPDAVATQAQVAAAFYIGTARRAKMDPWQLYSSRNINILGPVQAERLYDAIAEMENELAADPTSPAAQEAIKRVEEIRAEVEQMPGGAEVTQRALTPMVMPISAVDVGQRVVLEDSRSAVVTGRADGNVTVRIAGGETRTIAGDREVQVPGAVLRQERAVPTPNLEAMTNLREVFGFAQKNQFRVQRDFKLELQARAQAAAAEDGVDLTTFDTATLDYLVRVGVADAEYAMETNPNAIGWYERKVREALAISSLLYPEIVTDQNARFAFIVALAVTSNGIKVDKNFRLADEAYRAYRETGQMPTDVKAGTAQGAMNSAFALFNALVPVYGIDTLRKAMITQFDVGTLKAMGFDITGEHVDVAARGAAIFGPKIGNGFFSNLYGFFDALTIDRWLMRTWGRWTGNLVRERPDMVAKKSGELSQVVAAINQNPKAKQTVEKMLKISLDAPIEDIGNAVRKASAKEANRTVMNGLVLDGKDVGRQMRLVGNSLAGYLDGQIEAPTPDVRKTIRGVFQRVLEQLQVNNPDLTMADLQALLWYPEKLLYDSAVMEADAAESEYADDEAPDYSNAAVKLAQSKGITDEVIQDVLRRERAVDGRAAAARRQLEGLGADAGAGADVEGLSRQARRNFIARSILRRLRSDIAGDGTKSETYSRKGRGVRTSLRLLGQEVDVVERYAPSVKFRNRIEAADGTALEFLELAPGATSAQAFTDAITEAKNGTPFGPAVFVYSPEDYAGMRLFVAEDGRTGFALKPDGDIVSVFSYGVPGGARGAIELAIQQGGRKLDAFATVLPEYYFAHGMREVARLPWDDTQAPPDWDYDTFAEYNDGRPDVVFMVFDSEFAGPYEAAPYMPDYDAAVAAQDKALKDLATRPQPINAPQILRQSVTVSDESVSRLLDRAVDPDYVFVELPETIEVDGVQRPTRNNKGQQISRNAKGVQNFWRWFGDSKLVDEQGRPIVIYHGTKADVDFVEFRINTSELGIHTGTTEQANKFAAEVGRVTDAAGSRVYPLYGRLQNPLRLMDRGGFTSRLNVTFQLVELGLMTQEEREAITMDEGGDGIAERTDKQIEEATIRWLKDKGYDGVVYLNKYEGYTDREVADKRFNDISREDNTDAEWATMFPSAADSYIVFTPQQLKSTSNIGSFSRVKNILRQAPSEPVFDTRGEPSPVSRNVADATAIFGEGRFSVVTGLEETMRRKFFGTKATTPNEVAAGMSALARGADERFDVLLTDAKGKPISIVSGSKGGIAFASVPLNSVVFDIVRTPGAVNAWFVHNHPSGRVDLSADDKSINEQFANLLQGSGVEPKGVMAVGLQPDGTVRFQYQQSPYPGVETPALVDGVADISAKQKSVPFFERQIQQRTPVMSPPILGLGDALKTAETVAPGRDGLLMLNTRGEAVGFLELAEGDVKKLRYSAEMRKIQEGAALVNANYHVVIARGWGSRELGNIQRFINALNPGNLSLYDVIDPDARTSAMQDKQLLKATDTVFRQAQQARPNAFIMPGVSRTTIGLMRTANLSSLMHEFSHDYLNLLFDVADMPEATEEIRADAALVLKYFGVEEPSQITSEHQEKWARMFESYLMEGKAPSKELQSAFGRFRVWLNAIYRAVTSALVPVSPEIRGVFDRMLASDEQIAEAVQQDELGPLFESASEAGMSEAEFKAYREAVAARDENAKRTLMVRLVEEQNKERRQFWKDREAEVRQTVTEQVAMEPIQQVVHFLKTGTLLSGEALPEDATPYKLSKALLVSRYGPDLVKGIPRGTYSVEGGVDPDVVALAFGFDSGDAMISQMQAFEPRQARIDRIVKETMAQEFPDLLNDSPALAEAAQDAVHQAPSDQLLYAELVKLGKLDAMIPPTNLFAVRQAAKEIVAKTRIRDLVPDRFRRAEAKAGRLAYQAMRQGDKVKAAFHKRQQLLNHLLYREATASIELTNKAYKFFGKMAKGPYQQRLGKAGREYLEQMNALLDQYDFSRISGVEAERRMALSEWAAAQVARGIPVEIPASVLYATQRTNYRMLTVEQLQGVYDTGRQIYHVARNEGKLLAAAEKASFEEVVESVVAGIGEQHKIEPREPDYAPSKLKAVANALRKLDAWHVKPEFLFRWLDGDKEFGPVHQALFEPIAQAENAESGMVIEANKRVEALFNLIPKNRRKEYLSRRIQVPGVSTRMTGATALAMALNWGNTSNREALLEGTVAGRPVFTPQQIDAVLRTLTKAEWDFVQGVWDYINEFWPQIAELQRSLTGVAPEKVEAEAFTVTTADGETVNLRGGYYPLAYDQNYNWAQFKQDMAADVKDIGGNSYTRAATRHGFTEARVGSGGRPVKLDLSVFSEHVLNVIHDLTHRKAIMDVQKLAENAEVREAIEGTAGRDLYRTIRPWLVRVAGDRRSPASPIEDLVGRARTGVTVVNMGLKVTTAIVQPIGYLQSLEMLGANYGRRGLTAFFANPAKLASWVKEQSVAIRTRQQSFDRDVRDQTKRMLKKGPLTRAQESFFFFTGLMDMSVAIPTWYGAYLKSIETLRPGDHHAAVTYADSVVRMTQGSGAAKDLSQIQGGGELQRSFTVFYTYFNALYNLLRRSGALLKDRGPRDTGRFLASMAVLWFLPAVMSELIAGRGPDEDEEEDAMQWALWKMLKYPFSTVVGVRDIASAIGPEAYDYELSPVVSAGRSVVESINAIGKAAGEAYRGDGFELTEGEIKQFIMAIGYWGQLPSRQMWITGSYLYDWMMGYEEPESPSEVFEGLAFPRQK